MSEQTDFERYIADQLGTADVGTPPDAAITDTIERARGHRRLPEWLALIKEPPMRSNSHLAVGSPTVRVVAIVAATMLLALALATAGAGVQRLLAASPIIVAQDGGGDFTTITEALAAADDGDEIRVRSGTYVESVLIDKDIVLAGDGDPSTIVLDHTADSPTMAGPTKLGYTDLPYGLLLKESDATVRDLTLLARGVAIGVEGGTPSLENLIIDDPVETDDAGEALGPEPELWEGAAIVVGSGATPSVSGLATDAWIWVGEAKLELTDSDVANYIYLGDGSDSTIRGNEIAHIHVWRSSIKAVIEDNDLAGPAWPAEADNAIHLAVMDGSDVTVAGNRIGDPTYPTAVLVSGGGEIVIEDNVIRDSGTGVRFDTGSRAALRVEGNELTSNDWGIAISDHGGTATVVNNTVTSNGTGVFVSGGSDNAFEANVICDNETNVLLAVGGEAPDPGDNEICEDVAT